MGTNSSQIDGASIDKQIRRQFATVYLTLISIIQAVVFEYLIFSVDEHWLSMDLTKMLAVITTFILIICTWNEYMMGSVALTWMPKLKDAFIPFLLGISEWIVIRNIFSSIHLWFYSLALFCFFGWIAFYNMFRSARQYPENTFIFSSLGRLPFITEIWTLSSGVSFAFFGVILYKFASGIKMNFITIPSLTTQYILISGLTVQYIMVLFSLVMYMLFLYRGILYWNRILGIQQGTLFRRYLK
jgi:hypothetical protein